jgi:anaerobic magnesium-protoporphyrin IX monomethyl ester cyclase
VKERIVLLIPPLYFSAGTPKSLDVSAPALGVMYLASYINKYSDQFQAEVIDTGAEGLSLTQIGERINHIRPFALGISAMTPQLQGALELAAHLRKNSPQKVTTFMGGPHVSADPEFINRHNGLFDYAITGEAEKTFLASLNRLKRGEEIPAIQAGEEVKDLDEIPIPDPDLAGRGLYPGTGAILFSRGCPYNCYYCSRPSIDRNVRYRSVENVMTEIQQYVSRGTRQISFQDDTFTINRKPVLELCRRIASQRMEIKWGCNTRIDLVDDEVLSAMKKAGCEQIHFGIESGSERVRREVICKGNFTNQDIENVFRLCRKHGIRIGCYFMIGHATETEAELIETKKMILGSDFYVLGLSLPLPFPGSELWKIAERDGIVSQKIVDQFARKELGEGYGGIYPVYISKSLDPDFVYRQMKEINRKFYLNFRTFLNRVKQDIFSPSALVTDARDMSSLIFRGMSSRKPYRRNQTGASSGDLNRLNDRGPR